MRDLYKGITAVEEVLGLPHDGTGELRAKRVWRWAAGIWREDLQIPTIRDHMN